MADVNVGELIKCLVTLQGYDAQIYRLKRALEDKPAQLKELEAQFETKKANLKKLEEDLKAIQVRRGVEETELKAKEENIAKANTQLSSIKTNREYTAKIAEIESLKADRSLIEEKILQSYEDGDAVRTKITAEKDVVAAEEKTYLAQKKQVESEVESARTKIKELEGQRAAILPQVDKSILSRYEKILVNKHGMAIVPVEGHVCGGCYMNVPAQVINEMQIAKELIQCEMCARFLYLPDQAE